MRNTLYHNRIKIQEFLFIHFRFRWMFFLCFFNIINVFAQDNVQGVVKGNHELLQGVTVTAKESGLQTFTDINGAFKINASRGETLAFYIVGFDSLELMVENNKFLEVYLTPASKSLDEVVVLAYGKQKRLSVTGAVSTVGTKELMGSSSSNLAAALSGKLPGLSSMQTGGGQPGRNEATMYLRGAATTNGQQPLIMIDGVPRDNISTLDASEVESVTVLKDASATAVFGVRGANGVILVTTRRGQEGKIELNAAFDQGWTSLTREPERIHSLEYMSLRNEAARNDGLTTPPFSEQIIRKYANPLEGLDKKDPDFQHKARVREYMYPDHDYYRMFISKYAPQSKFNLNAFGGTNKVAYFFNGSFLKEGGNLNTEPKSELGYDPSSWMHRYNFRANLDYKVSKSISAFLNIGSYIERVNMPSAEGAVFKGNTWHMMRDLIFQAQSILPITPGPVTIAGFGVAPGQIVDPTYMDWSAFETMNRNGYRNEVRSFQNASFGLDVSLDKVTKGLTLKGIVSYDSRANTAVDGHKSERLYIAEINPETDEMQYAVGREDEQLLSLIKGADSRYNINLQGSLNYARTFGHNHDVGGMILAQRDYWESTRGEIPFNVIGIASRFTYGYDNRYLAEFNAGYNGSEQFAPDNRFGFFPAISLGWVISNERFMPKAKWLSNLKIRGSYGKVGNDRMGGGRFLYQSNITMGGGSLGSLGRGQGVNQGLLGNPAITWEVAAKQNYGLDLKLLNEIDLVFDYFLEDRSDILISRASVPEFQGVPLNNLPRVNMGNIKNEGFELELIYNKTIGKKLNFILRGNYGQNKNFIKFIDEPMRDESYVHQYRRTGYSLEQRWGYKIDYSNGNGIFNSKEELNNYLAKTTYGFGVPRVGDFKYLDLNQDGVIDDRDLAPIGFSSIPGVVYGFGLSLNYQNIGISAFFQGVSKYSREWQASQGVYEYTYQGTYFGYHKNAWTPERYEAGEKITYPALSTRTTTNHVPNDFFIMNRSYLRLRDVEIAYSIPDKFLKQLALREIRVYMRGHNMFLWDRLPMSHLDPENIDPIGYPVTKMLNIGLTAKF